MTVLRWLLIPVLDNLGTAFIMEVTIVCIAIVLRGLKEIENV